MADIELGVQGSYTLDDITVYFEAIRGPVHTHEDGEESIEMDARFLDDEGLPFRVQIGGDGFVDADWQADLEEAYAAIENNQVDHSKRETLFAISNYIATNLSDHIVDDLNDLNEEFQNIIALGLRDADQHHIHQNEAPDINSIELVSFGVQDQLDYVDDELIETYIPSQYDSLDTLIPGYYNDFQPLGDKEDDYKNVTTNRNHNSGCFSLDFVNGHYDHEISLNYKSNWAVFYIYHHSATHIKQNCQICGATVLEINHCNHGDCAASMSNWCWAAYFNRKNSLRANDHCDNDYAATWGKPGHHNCHDDSYYQWNETRYNKEYSNSTGYANCCSDNTYYDRLDNSGRNPCAGEGPYDAISTRTFYTWGSWDEIEWSKWYDDYIVFYSRTGLVRIYRTASGGKLGSRTYSKTLSNLKYMDDVEIYNSNNQNFILFSKTNRTYVYKLNSNGTLGSLVQNTTRIGSCDSLEYFPWWILQPASMAGRLGFILCYNRSGNAKIHYLETATGKVSSSYTSHSNWKTNIDTISFAESLTATSIMFSKLNGQAWVYHIAPVGLIKNVDYEGPGKSYEEWTREFGPFTQFMFSRDADQGRLAMHRTVERGKIGRKFGQWPHVPVTLGDLPTTIQFSTTTSVVHYKDPNGVMYSIYYSKATNQALFVKHGSKFQ
ncbi:MAG: hypothetical protein GY854_20765 [Deltaproteobacteria bacterium]|nr:hypothetical protein [Deltaproteobacteria bacterium]